MKAIQNTSRLLICAISVGAVLAATNAGAQNLTATLATYSPSQGVNGTVNDGALTMDYPSGVMDFTDFDAFCVQPSILTSYGQTVVYQIQDVGLLTNSTQIAKLVGGYLASGQGSLDAAGAQWAIWEIVKEESLNPLSLLDGNVRITVPKDELVANRANWYLANIDSFAPAELTYLTSSTHQDVVTWNIPEPSSACLVALSALVCLRRRR